MSHRITSVQYNILVPLSAALRLEFFHPSGTAFMNSVAASLFVFGCAFGGAVLGMFLRRVLPENHVSDESKDVIRICMGLVASTVALVLGLLVYSAKGFYDTQTSEVTQLAANVLLLDRVLARYGPESADARSELRNAINHQTELLWPEQGSRSANLQAIRPTGEVVVDKIQQLSPKDDRQRTLQSQSLNLALQLGQTRFLMYTQRSVPVPKPLLFIVVFWLIALFISFGLFAPVNYTVVVSLLTAAAAASGAIFLMIEMYYPYGGLIQVSPAPLRAVMEQIGR